MPDAKHPRPGKGRTRRNRTEGLFVRVAHDFCRNPSVTSAMARVGLALASRMPNSFPSFKTIAKDTGLSNSTISRAIEGLEQLGVLKRVRGGLGRGSNRYEVHLFKEHTLQKLDRNQSESAPVFNKTPLQKLEPKNNNEEEAQLSSHPHARASVAAELGERLRCPVLQAAFGSDDAIIEALSNDLAPDRKDLTTPNGNEHD